MKIPLKIEKLSEDVDLYEDVQKIIKYKITNDNRFVVKEIDVVAYTIKENGEKTNSNYVKKITGISPRLIPKDSCEINVTVRLNKEFRDTIEIDGKQELSAISLDLKVTGTLVIGR